MHVHVYAYAGLLESVSNLTVTSINSTTVLISWSPPFTLEGVPILGYNVTITSTTSGENEIMLVEDTTLLYSIDHPNLENSNFTVTVVPNNEVGAGDSRTVTIKIPFHLNSSSANGICMQVIHVCCFKSMLYSDTGRPFSTLLAASTIILTTTSKMQTSSVFVPIDINHGNDKYTCQYTTNNQQFAKIYGLLNCIIMLGTTSAVQLIIIITPPVAVISSLLLLSFILMICCMKRSIKNKGTGYSCVHIHTIFLLTYD